ncbi:hypothetical protein HOB10_00710 [Candidatus Parcubacteria bacterium]|jgi:hypothetical protein|nr:hypothetical protein [Candidatus Parcubacteria bacterium]
MKKPSFKRILYLILVTIIYILVYAWLLSSKNIELGLIPLGILWLIVIGATKTKEKK